MQEQILIRRDILFIEDHVLFTFRIFVCAQMIWNARHVKLLLTELPVKQNQISFSFLYLLPFLQNKNLHEVYNIYNSFKT